MSSLVLALLAPIIVVVLGIVTRRVFLSLCTGIVVAAVIAGGFSVLAAAKLLVLTLATNLDLPLFYTSSPWQEGWNLFICVFLLLLGSFVVLLQETGGTKLYAAYMSKYVRNTRQAESSCLILSFLLFLDDYFSSLTVGSVMKPLTDHYKIPREKLAFLVDSMAAPLTILCPFSTWVAAIMGFLRDNGVQETLTEKTLIVGNPLMAHIHIMPYIFYSFLVIVATVIIVGFKLSYGKMQSLEEQAKNHDKGTCLQDVVIEQIPFAKVIYLFFLPIVSLVISVLFGFLLSGDCWLFGGARNIMEALQHSNAAIGLIIGGLVAFGFNSCYFLALRRLRLEQLATIIVKGFKLMLPSILILILSWTLGDLLRNKLHLGEQLAGLILSLGIEDVALLPLGFFILSLLVAFVIGSSWGTAALVFPIAIPMFMSLQGIEPGVALADVPMLYPILGAVLSGCVAGDHISPISDTTIMTSTSTGCLHFEHVYTQLRYTWPVLLATALSYLCISSSLHILPGIIFYIVIIGGILFSTKLFSIFLLQKRKYSSLTA